MRETIMWNFRLKVDLSRFFNDARQLGRIFIDVAKIQQIQHVKQHISKLFDIKDPFHLLLNENEYLAPTEDVRVLQEEETVLVIPGLGVDNRSTLNTSSIASDTEPPANISVCESLGKTNKCNGNVPNDAKPTDIAGTRMTAQQTLDVSNEMMNTIQSNSNNDSTINLTYHTVINDTETETDLKNTDCSNLTENINTMDLGVSPVKRKRTRKRKSKKTHFDELPLNKNEESTVKKPKIIDSIIIPRNKHIRFNDTEEESNIAKQITYEVPLVKCNIDQPSKLSTLLALRQCSTPVTYAKKMKNEIEMENSIDENLNKSKEDSNNKDDNLCVRENNKETKSFGELTHMNLEKIPIMTRKPQVGDIIAFKRLKLSMDYTPQVSNFIIAEVSSFCAESTSYSFKIFKGKEEIVEPSGKFSFSEEVSGCDDEILFTYSQLREPRLIT